MTAIDILAYVAVSILIYVALLTFGLIVWMRVIAVRKWHDATALNHLDAVRINS